MRLTVAICTWNRSDLLRQTLDQMTHLVIPAGVEWELLVVNNNCTDGTDSVLASLADRLPLRRVFEPTPGKSYALNLAVAEATGQYILWTDDDVLVSERWLAAYHEAFKRWPDASFFGGPIRPWFVGKPPRWLERALPHVETAYAIRDLGPEPFQMDRWRNPFGANMAVKRADQLRHLYDPRLGPKQAQYATGEEAAMVFGMLEQGLSGWWVPGAVVRHYLPTHRQSTTYLRKYFTGHGNYMGREELPKELPEKFPQLFGKPRYLWRQYLESEAKYRLLRYVAPPEVWVKHLIESSLARGQLQTYAPNA
ncbi:MAG: glycosyltransferase [Gemmatimonadaceae bacterium]